MNVKEESHVPFLCAKLEEEHGFSDKELQQLPNILENCQHRPDGHEFLLRLTHSSNNHRTVVDFAKELRTR